MNIGFVLLVQNQMCIYTHWHINCLTVFLHQPEYGLQKIYLQKIPFGRWRVCITHLPVVVEGMFGGVTRWILSFILSIRVSCRHAAMTGCSVDSGGWDMFGHRLSNSIYQLCLSNLLSSKAIYLELSIYLSGTIYLSIYPSIHPSIHPAVRHIPSILNQSKLIYSMFSIANGSRLKINDQPNCIHSSIGPQYLAKL